MSSEKIETDFGCTLNPTVLDQFSPCQSFSGTGKRGTEVTEDCPLFRNLGPREFCSLSLAVVTHGPHAQHFKQQPAGLLAVL